MIGAGRLPTVVSHAIDELEDQTKAREVEEVVRPRRVIAPEWGGVVGAAQGDGGMPAVGEPDDEIRIKTPAEPDDLDPLSAERMMRMGDGDEARRRLGGEGSALSGIPTTFIAGDFLARSKPPADAVRP